MSQRLNDYFAGEAAEYLEQLESLLSIPGKPDADHFLRLATGVRGSAQMAGAETVAGVAERLEDAARSIVSSNVAWSQEIRQLSQQTVGDLKLLIRALNRWGQDEERRVREAINRWDDVEGGRRVDSPAALSVRSLFYDDAGPHVVEPTDGGDPKPTSIEKLLYRGSDALQEALALRSAFDEIAMQEPVPAQRLSELVEELFDLLELSLGSEPPEV